MGVAKIDQQVVDYGQAGPTSADRETNQALYFHQYKS